MSNKVYLERPNKPNLSCITHTLCFSLLLTSRKLCPITKGGNAIALVACPSATSWAPAPGLGVGSAYKTPDYAGTKS